MKHVTFKLVYPDGTVSEFECWAGYIGKTGTALHALDASGAPRCRATTRRHSYRADDATITCKKCLAALDYLKRLPGMRDWREE